MNNSAPSQEYNQSMNVLKVNGVINPDEVVKLGNFRKLRNRSIHKIFNGMSRDEWNKNNKTVVDLGKPIVVTLEKKIAALVSVRKSE